MTVRFKCDCCGVEADVSDYTGEEDVILAPKGWRRIWTEIDVVGETGAQSGAASECAHACVDCSVHMSLAEHVEAEHEHRVSYMSQPGVDGADLKDQKQ